LSPSSDEDSPFLAADAFIDWLLVQPEISRVIDSKTRNRWTAKLAEHFAHFAGKD
jgi:hypothetical protein